MAAINFPDSPSNGDTHTVGGVTYTYNSAETKWKTTINSNAFLPLSGGTVSGNLNVSGDVTVDTNTLYVDSANNRVGVGTTSPLAELEVQGAATPEVMVRNTTTSSYSSLHLAEVGDSSGTFVVNRLGSTSTATGGARAGQIWNSANAPIVFGTNGTEAMRLLSGGDLRFNSGYGSVATAYGCRAWASWRGDITSGGNSQLNGSGNVSSVTDNGSGDYTINFTNAMPDQQYVVVGNCIEDATNNRGDHLFTMHRSGRATGSVRVNTINLAGTPIDDDFVFAAVIR